MEMMKRLRKDSLKLVKHIKLFLKKNKDKHIMILLSEPFIL